MVILLALLVGLLLGAGVGWVVRQMTFVTPEAPEVAEDPALVHARHELAERVEALGLDQLARVGGAAGSGGQGATSCGCAARTGRPAMSSATMAPSSMPL